MASSFILLCSLLIVGGARSYNSDIWTNEPLADTDEFVDQTRDQLASLIQMFVTLIKMEVESEGRTLVLPEIPAYLKSPKQEFSTLEELLDSFERICQSLRARILKLTKAHATDSDMQQTEFTDGALIISSITDAPDFVEAFVDENDSVIEHENFITDSAEQSDLQDFLEYVTFDSSGDIDEHEETAYIASDASEAVVEQFTQYVPSDKTKTGELKETAEFEVLEALTTKYETLDGQESNIPDGTSATDQEPTYYGDGFEDRSGLLQEFEDPQNVVPIRGIPGESFPNYEEFPLTPFSCAEKKYIPGFYADLDTDCQVFHVCWSTHRESLLCPAGTTFNQAILSCDYWYKSNCSHAPSYYYLNEYHLPSNPTESTSFPKNTSFPSPTERNNNSDSRYLNTLTLLSGAMKFPPVNFKTVYYPQNRRELDGATSSANPKFSKHFKPKASTSKTEALVEKILAELLSSSASIVKGIEEAISVPVLEKSLQHRIKFKGKRQIPEESTSPKIQRSGDEYPTQPYEAESTSTMASISEIDSNKDKHFDHPEVFKTKHQLSEHKAQIAPAIVLTVLKVADDIINHGILPLTRQALSVSYSKHNKVNK